MKLVIKRQDAICPIKAGVAHTGGGGKIFKLVGKRQNPWYLSFPWQSPPIYNLIVGKSAIIFLCLNQTPVTQIAQESGTVSTTYLLVYY